MAKSLVIGATGLVGGALMRVLEQSGIEAVGTFFSHSRPGLIPLDIKNRKAVHNLFAEVHPDVAYIAVNIGVDYCEQHPEEANALNIEGIRHIVSAAEREATKIVYYSTAYVFNGQHGPYSEDDKPNPVNVYGATKCSAEKLIPSSHLIIRTMNVFGWDRTSHNFAMQVWKYLQANKSFSAVDDQLGNPTLAEYLAEASIRLVQDNANGIFNIVGKEIMTRFNFAQALARAMSLDTELITLKSTVDLNQTATRPRQAGLKTNKLEQFLGTEAMSFGEAMKRFRRHWRADTHTSYPSASVNNQADTLKCEILEKVKEYHALTHKSQPFIPYKSRIQYSGRVFGEEEMVNLVDSSLDFWLTLGPYGDLFESKMKKFFGARDFVFVNSGSSANLTAVMALMSKELDNPLRPGDEVITPAVTFPTTVAPLVHGGLVPVFVDCEIGTYNINPQLIEGAISEKTRAIMVPHTLGNPCDMDMICDIVKEYDLYLIEDTCDALSSTFRGDLVGTFGDLATLSFYPAHHISTGEGGAVIVNRGRLSRIVRSVRDWGRSCWCASGESNSCGKRFGWQLGDLPKGFDHKYCYSNIGYNFKPTDMQAAIGVAQAERIAEFVEKRRRNFARLSRGLEEYQDHLILPTYDSRSDPAWFALPLTVQGGISRNSLVQYLENANIETRELFGGNILRQPGYKDIACLVHGTLEQSDRIMRDTFFIGVYPGLTEEMIDFTLSIFAKFFKERA